MKKNSIKFLIFIAIAILIESIVFLTFGVINNILWLVILGGVCCGLYVILIDFYLLKTIKQNTKEKLEKHGSDLKTVENELVEEVNNSQGLDNYINIRTHQFANISHAWKVASIWERLQILFLILLVLSGITAIIVLICLKYIVAGIIVFGVQVLLICGVLLLAKFREKQSLIPFEIDEFELLKTGKVIACCLYAQKTISKGSMSSLEYEHKHHLESKMTTRILSTVYKIKIDLDGKKVIAYSNKFFNEGEKVSVCQNRKHKTIYRIVENNIVF